MNFTLSQIAECVGGELFGDDRIVISGVGPLMGASEGQISFFTHPRYKDDLAKTKASAVIVSRRTDLFHGAQIVVSNPSLAYARVAALFAPPPSRYPGVSDRAFIHESAALGHNVSIYPFVYVGEGTEIGNDVILYCRPEA